MRNSKYLGKRSHSWWITPRSEDGQTRSPASALALLLAAVFVLTACCPPSAVVKLQLPKAMEEQSRNSWLLIDPSLQPALKTPAIEISSSKPATETH